MLASPLHKQGKGISEKLTQLPRVTRVVNGEASVELGSVQPQSCAIFPHSKQSHLKSKLVLDTPLSIFPSPKLLQDPACWASACLSCHTRYSSCPCSLLPGLLAFLLFLGITKSLTQGRPLPRMLFPQTSADPSSFLQVSAPVPPPQEAIPRDSVKKRPLSSPYPAAHISQQHLPAPEHILG